MRLSFRQITKVHGFAGCAREYRHLYVQQAALALIDLRGDLGEAFG
ncbi:MAG: hypothetical protein WBW33_00030 [Bryobacteraceae bacterium]